jgi:hypothetical protein
MLLESFVVAVILTCRVKAQNLAPTEQTTFRYPANGAGMTLPFPPSLASLTGLSNWPALGVVPPFTPNMAATFNSAGIPDLPHTSDCSQVPGYACSFWCNGCTGNDIIAAPSVQGSSFYHDLTS